MKWAICVANSNPLQARRIYAERYLKRIIQGLPACINTSLRQEVLKHDLVQFQLLNGRSAPRY